jgi:hypothetical protein
MSQHMARWQFADISGGSRNKPYVACFSRNVVENERTLHRNNIFCCKVWDFHGIDYEGCRLLRSDAVRLLLESTLLVTANDVPSSLTSLTLMMEAIRCFEISVRTRSTRRHIPEDSILQHFPLINGFCDVVPCSLACLWHWTYHIRQCYIVKTTAIFIPTAPLRTPESRSSFSRLKLWKSLLEHRRYVTNRKVAGSRPDEVKDFYQVT